MPLLLCCWYITVSLAVIYHGCRHTLFVAVSLCQSHTFFKTIWEVVLDQKRTFVKQPISFPYFCQNLLVCFCLYTNGLPQSQKSLSKCISCYWSWSKTCFRQVWMNVSCVQWVGCIVDPAVSSSLTESWESKLSACRGDQGWARLPQVCQSSRLVLMDSVYTHCTVVNQETWQCSCRTVVIWECSNRLW